MRLDSGEMVGVYVSTQKEGQSAVLKEEPGEHDDNRSSSGDSVGRPSRSHQQDGIVHRLARHRIIPHGFS
jgi:hypothetical protein